MSQLVITGFYASLLVLLFLVLSFNVIKLRYKYKVGLGDGDHAPLKAAIRIHSNFAEYIPLSLILLASYELNGGHAVVLHLLGASLFVGRIFHQIGLTKISGASIQRKVGMISTFFVLLILAVENIRLFLMG